MEVKSSALLIIDMINDFNFTDGDLLHKNTVPIAKNIRNMKKYARDMVIPVIYVNDNFGKWKSNFNVLVEHCINDNTLGKDIVKLLKPDEEDYFVLKPMHSAFYSTTLEVLLENLKIDTIILTGVKTESCILSTAIDAYMRGYNLIVLNDCVASINENQDFIFEILKHEFKAKVVNSIDLKE